MAAPGVLLYTAVTAVTPVTLCTGSNNWLSQHFDVAAVWQQAEHETEYAVSPNTPLLSTEVQENAWVCGEFAWREHSPQPYIQLPTWLNSQQRIAAAQSNAEAGAVAYVTDWCLLFHGAPGDNGKGQLGAPGSAAVLAPVPIQVQSLSSGKQQTKSDSNLRFCCLEVFCLQADTCMYQHQHVPAKPNKGLCVATAQLFLLLAAPD
jgi:hypothetical protein